MKYFNTYVINNEIYACARVRKCFSLSIDECMQLFMQLHAKFFNIIYSFFQHLYPNEMIRSKCFCYYFKLITSKFTSYVNQMRKICICILCYFKILNLISKLKFSRKSKLKSKIKFIRLIITLFNYYY